MHSTTIDIPRIETERLILRSFAPGDFESYAAMMADPEVVRHLGDGKPLSRADAWRQLAMFAGHWVLRGFGVWAVEERASGTLIGRIGCFEPDGHPGFEIAYTLARRAWGRGYAREGAAVALAYAREVLGREEIISVIRPTNTASIGVARSLGAAVDRSIEFYGALAEVYCYPAR